MAGQLPVGRAVDLSGAKAQTVGRAVDLSGAKAQKDLIDRIDRLEDAYNRLREQVQHIAAALVAVVETAQALEAEQEASE